MNYFLLSTGLIIVIVFILLVWAYKPWRSFSPEKWIDMPFIVPIPPNVGHPPNTFIEYNPDYLKSLCPTSFGGPNNPCTDRSDCPGKAEICVNSAGGLVGKGLENIQPESSRCVCSISNKCMEEGIC